MKPAQKKRDTGGHAPNRSQPVVVPEIAIYNPLRKNKYTTLPPTLVKKKPGTQKHPPVPSNFPLPPHNVETTQPPVACDSSFSSSLKTTAVGKKNAPGVPRKKNIEALGEVLLPDTLLRQLAAKGFDTRSLLGGGIDTSNYITSSIWADATSAPATSASLTSNNQPQPDSQQLPTKYLHPGYPPRQQQYRS